MLTLHYLPGSCSLAPHIMLEGTFHGGDLRLGREDRQAGRRIAARHRFKDRMLPQWAIRTVKEFENSLLTQA